MELMLPAVDAWSPNHGTARAVPDTAIFKMENQQGPTCIAQGTLLNVMWQPGWEGSWGENVYMYVYG